jgi:hypothetical protein
MRYRLLNVTKLTSFHIKTSLNLILAISTTSKQTLKFFFAFSINNVDANKNNIIANQRDDHYSYHYHLKLNLKLYNDIEEQKYDDNFEIKSYKYAFYNDYII